MATGPSSFLAATETDVKALAVSCPALQIAPVRAWNQCEHCLRVHALIMNSGTPVMPAT